MLKSKNDICIVVVAAPYWVVDEDDEKKIWIGVLLMMKIVKKMMEGEEIRWIIQTLMFFWIFLIERTKAGNNDKDKVFKQSFFLVNEPKRYQINI